jgi:hypothetical protein
MSELNLDKPSEHLDYELISAYDTEGNEFWNVSFLRSPYEDVTIRYNNVQLDGTSGTMRFNFDIIESENPENTLENLEMQRFAADVLQDILEAAITTREENDRNQSTADDSTESTD